MNESTRSGGAPAAGPDPVEVEVRELIEGAGTRPEIPPAALGRIRAAMRSEWERLPERSPGLASFARRRLALALAASLLVAVAIGWLLVSRGPAPAFGVVATVELVRGDARIELAASPELSAGRILTTGATVATGAGERRGVLALRLADGGSLRLDAATRVRLVSSTEVALETGAVYVDSDSLRPGATPVAIDTRFGRVREIGTRFEVRVGGDDRDAELSVRVRDGRVALERGAREHSVAAGEGLWLHRDGTLESRPVDPHGAAWDWVLAAAPAPDVEGLSLAAFLGWVGRETGWTVEFADDELAQSAAGIQLHGTIEGLRPEQAVEVVVSGAGLESRIEEGVLSIARP